jgi:hypothetical protein
VLLREPAYVDNMSLVTPVPVSCFNGLTRTVGYDSNQFVARVKSTMCFLRYLKDSEAIFWNSGARRLQCKPEEFGRRAKEARIRPLCASIIEAYARRLTVLRERGLLPPAMRDAFDKVIHDPVFKPKLRERAEEAN